ncbi:MAG: hypothetical protein AAGC95_05795, partial [Pseudomonadota bacterium]
GLQHAKDRAAFFDAQLAILATHVKSFREGKKPLCLLGFSHFEIESTQAIKAENWRLTPGWRSNFSHCLLFYSTDPNNAKTRLSPPMSAV